MLVDRFAPAMAVVMLAWTFAIGAPANAASSSETDGQSSDKGGAMSAPGGAMSAPGGAMSAPGGSMSRPDGSMAPAGSMSGPAKKDGAEKKDEGAGKDGDKKEGADKGGGEKKDEKAEKEEKKTPEQKMQSRFPQPARVGDLIGLPVLDDDDVTLGRVREVVRTAAGKVVLVVDYNPWFGWFGWRTRPVAVPIETVAILARQIAAVDMPPDEFAAAPTWSAGDSTPIGKDEKIRIAVTRR